MENKRITDIETAEFDTLIEAFIERETEDMGELSAPLFYETLEAIFQELTEAIIVELEAQVNFEPTPSHLRSIKNYCS
ncbi:MAG: hypothetical protein ACE5LU_13590 [Anaerolineae bacterium]